MLNASTHDAAHFFPIPSHAQLKSILLHATLNRGPSRPRRFEATPSPLLAAALADAVGRRRRPRRADLARLLEDVCERFVAQHPEQPLHLDLFTKRRMFTFDRHRVGRALNLMLAHLRQSVPTQPLELVVSRQDETLCFELADRETYRWLLRHHPTYGHLEAPRRGPCRPQTRLIVANEIAEAHGGNLGLWQRRDGGCALRLQLSEQAGGVDAGRRRLSPAA